MRRERGDCGLGGEMGMAMCWWLEDDRRGERVCEVCMVDGDFDGRGRGDGDGDSVGK